MTVTREIEIRAFERQYVTRSFVFPGGELQVQVPDIPPRILSNAIVIARLQSAEDLVRLVLVKDVLDRHSRDNRVRLVVPYWPYARQDRVMQPGEAFSLRAVAAVINGLGFDETVTCDPHSEVTPAVVRNLRVLSQAEIVGAHRGVRRFAQEHGPVIIAPDAGALKKATAVARALGAQNLVTATKVRNVLTGEITGTRLDDPEEIVKGRACLIVDDICDGGRTFVELARRLRQHGAKQTALYVTHGIFSRGLAVFESCLDAIFTTDSFLWESCEPGYGPPVDVLPITETLIRHDA